MGQSFIKLDVIIVTFSQTLNKVLGWQMHLSHSSRLSGLEAETCWSVQDTQGNTPLHYAAGYGRGEFVKDLIDAGAKGFSQNNNGHTPCDLVRSGPLSACSFLLC